MICNYYNWAESNNIKQESIQRENDMDILYAPWRTSYSPKNRVSDEECPFCNRLHQSSEHDESNLIIKRLRYCAVMLNLYPYGKGHALIIPYKHTNNLDNLTIDERSELIETVNDTTKLLEEFLKCDGINIGINKGKAAGGSIQSHLHIHILPRFIGDTNFLITANTKVITNDIIQLYRELKNIFT